MYKDGYVYKFDIFRNEKIIHGISTRHFGTMKEKKKINENNLLRFLEALPVERKKFILADQIHSGNIQYISTTQKLLFEGTDGFITKEKDIFMGIRTADCLPVMFYDPIKETAGIVHAGYKGILKDIIANMIDQFMKLESHVSSIKVAISPCINVCCYTVSSERIELFKKKFPFKNMYIQKDGQYYLNLPSIALSILLAKGIKKEHIEIADMCTKDHTNEFYSYRGDSDQTFGQFMSVIGQI